jgi:hypothetical protein
LPRRQLLIEYGEQRRIVGVLRHHADEVHKIALAKEA